MQDVADYLCDRIHEHWIEDLLVATQELPEDLVERAREAMPQARQRPIVMPQSPTDHCTEEQSHSGPASVAPAAQSMADVSIGALALTEEAQSALSWSTGCKDSGMLADMASRLTDWCLQEQIRAYKARSCTAIAVPSSSDDGVLFVNPTLERHKRRVCIAFREFCEARGIKKGERLPHGIITKFLTQRVRWMRPMQLKNARQLLSKWFRLSSNFMSLEAVHHRATPHGYRASVISKFRKRRLGLQGRPVRAPIVRQGLFEWFVSMRYAVNWRKPSAAVALRNGGEPQKKCVARFPRVLLVAKCKQLLADYAYLCLMQGIAVKLFDPTDEWFKCWENEFGLSMRNPNRQYKVGGEILWERLEIYWLNLAKVRMLCILVFGYDPDMSNWDQTPYHENEVGAQAGKTLAIAGAVEVPVNEHPGVTHSRWTANLTTFSNKESLSETNLPWAELMFKYDGDIIRKRLQKYIIDRGYPSWLSVTTSPSGSYKEGDVLDFCERHMPPASDDLPWGISLADDYSAHKTCNVFRLCWTKKKVHITHGGGATPVTQTCDTDLNQHVRKDYVTCESAELLAQMRSGAKVPKLKAERCIDIMVRVLSQWRLHANAADGYKKTGANVALDGSEDHLICREAKTAWNDQHMREKTNREVEIVKREFKEGRLKWTYADVRRLITPYPKRKCDKVLQRQGELASVVGEGCGEDGDEAGNSDEGSDTDEGNNNDDGNDNDDENDSDGAKTIAAVELGANGELSDGADAATIVAAGADGEVEGATVEEPSKREDIVVDEAVAEKIETGTGRLQVYRQALQQLRDCGAMSAAVSMQNEIRKEIRRQRLLQTESPAVAAAFLRQRDLEILQQIESRRKVAEANENEKALETKRRALTSAAAELQKKKAKLLDVEQMLEVQHSIKRFSLKSLGDEQKKSGGAKCRKQRCSVLDRFARLGTQLSPEQKNDWDWFKEAWDEKMATEHAEAWGGVFATWMQQVLDDIHAGVSNAFSLFVHNETRRCLDDLPMLAMPG